MRGMDQLSRCAPCSSSACPFLDRRSVSRQSSRVASCSTSRDTPQSLRQCRKEAGGMPTFSAPSSLPASPANQRPVLRAILEEASMRLCLSRASQFLRSITVTPIAWRIFFTTFFSSAVQSAQLFSSTCTSSLWSILPPISSTARSSLTRFTLCSRKPELKSAFSTVNPSASAWSASAYCRLINTFLRAEGAISSNWQISVSTNSNSLNTQGNFVPITTPPSLSSSFVSISASRVAKEV
mmetsp:Transcript_230/g.463  ORF Transcript_230/g.463 Transcript_230/m.463 type:complete len:239 (-) Transcript_230:25-741(-)